MLRIVIKVSCIIYLVSLTAACMLSVQEREDQADVGQQVDKLPQYQQAIARAKDGEVDQAIELLEKVTRTSPDFTNVYTNLGLQYLQKKDLDQAEQAFDKAISLDATNYTAYNHRGVIMRRKGDFSAANEMYLAAIKHNPDYANAHHNLAILYDIYLYDQEQALYHYKKYQLLTNDSDKQVEKWIVDLERQITNKNKGGD